MAKITIEHENGDKTVIENAIDWEIWDSEDVDGIVSDHDFEITEEDKQDFYQEVHNKCFELDHVCNHDDLIEIVEEIMEDYGYEPEEQEEEDEE